MTNTEKRLEEFGKLTKRYFLNRNTLGVCISGQAQYDDGSKCFLKYQEEISYYEGEVKKDQEEIESFLATSIAQAEQEIENKYETKILGLDTVIEGQSIMIKALKGGYEEEQKALKKLSEDLKD